MFYVQKCKALRFAFFNSSIVLLVISLQMKVLRFAFFNSSIFLLVISLQMKLEKGKTSTVDKTNIEINKKLNQSDSIEEFYSDTAILLTGATGFVEKGLLEKFMRVCPRIAAIFILLRPKKNQTLEEQFKKLVDDPVRK